MFHIWARFGLIAWRRFLIFNLNEKLGYKLCSYLESCRRTKGQEEFDYNKMQRNDAFLLNAFSRDQKIKIRYKEIT